MPNCYLASPFWTRYEKLVKIFMKESVKSMGFDIVDPEECGNLSTDKSENKYKFAVEIFDNNIKDINKSECLVFPRFTTDLGTLFEVGYALGLKKKIYRYEFLSDSVVRLRTCDLTVPEYMLDPNFKVLINIDEQVDAITFGFLAATLPNAEGRLSYSLKGCKDNLMLSARYSYQTDRGLVRPEDRNWEEMR